MAEKVSPAKLADLAIMRAMGMTAEKIAEALDISIRTVERYVAEWRERAEEVGPHQAFIEVILNAGPTWGLFKFTPLKFTPDEFMNELKGGEK